MTKKGRGRPRHNPNQLARWSPPEGWVRVVAWVSPEERKALKYAALESDTSVASLIRSLASALSAKTLDPEALITQRIRGELVMEKIPTIFQRGDDFKVVDRPNVDCSWVFSGEGTATEKLDGTNVRLTIRSGTVVRVEKRRNPSKVQKKRGIIDGWYVDASEFSPEDKWIYEAVKGTVVSDWPDGEHSCEALGPKIQGNPLGLEHHLCVPFNLQIPIFESVPRDYDGLREFMIKLESKYAPGHSAEGIVFHHSDGRRAKIKRKDFSLN
jgi:hypothetical protein